MLLEHQFDSTAKKIQFIRESHNSTYKVLTEGAPFVLRVTSLRHRTLPQLEAELDFQTYLQQKQAPVVRPMAAQRGRTLIEANVDGTVSYIAAFSFASGRNWDERADNSEGIWKVIGSALGKIHRASRQYQPKPHIQKRRPWYESQHLVKAPDLFSGYDGKLAAVFQRDMAQYRKLPAVDGCFGLTHADYLLSNYMIGTDNTVTVIDFDECEYSWYAVVLAICMHCYLIGGEPTKLPEKYTLAETMLYHLLLGYTAENSMDAQMLSLLQSFFRIRDYIYLSTILVKGTGLNEWDQQFLDTAMHRLINTNEFLHFDMTRSIVLLS